MCPRAGVRGTGEKWTEEGGSNRGKLSASLSQTKGRSKKGSSLIAEANHIKMFNPRFLSDGTCPPPPLHSRYQLRLIPACFFSLSLFPLPESFFFSSSPRNLYLPPFHSLPSFRTGLGLTRFKAQWKKTKARRGSKRGGNPPSYDDIILYYDYPITRVTHF